MEIWGQSIENAEMRTRFPYKMAVRAKVFEMQIPKSWSGKRSSSFSHASSCCSYTTKYIPTAGSPSHSTRQSMRFFRFVSCYGPPTLPDAPDSPRRMEDDATLAPLACASRGRLAARKTSAGRSSAALWRPSLMAISEDSVVCAGPADKGERTVRSSGKNLAGKGSSRAKIVVTDYNERFGHSTLPAVFPAFSPTAFLF